MVQKVCEYRGVVSKMETLEAFRYQRGKLLVLDQLKLPANHEYINVDTIEKGWEVINKMKVYIKSMFPLPPLPPLFSLH